MAKRKQKFQRKVTKRKKKSRKWNISTKREDSASSSTDSSSPAKKKKKAKLWRHHQLTLSSSSTASDSSTDEEPHSDRFKMITEWKLPKSMTNYANKYFEEYAPENSLKEAILCRNPVPDNLDNFKKLDDFLRYILQKNGKQTNKHCVKSVQIRTRNNSAFGHFSRSENIENVWENLQPKTVDVMSPLSQLLLCAK